MGKPKSLDEAFSDKERMELIWVGNGIKPVGEIKKNVPEYKALLDDLGFYTETYRDRLFYSMNPSLVDELKHAMESRDYNKEGTLWGFPSCCSEYFSKLKARGLDPYNESLKKSKERLKNNEFVPAYFHNYAICPACNSTRNSPSGNLEEMMAEALKSEDYKLYERFRQESNGKLRYVPTAKDNGIVVWDYSKPGNYAAAGKY